MGVISKLEGGLDNAFDRAAQAVFRGSIEPAQIAKRAEKQMNREKLVGAGKQHAPTLYTVLVGPGDNQKLFAFYPTIAAEIETYLTAKGTQGGLKFDGRPLVRFIVDKGLKSGKFDVIAEVVSAPTIAKLREEELEYYELKGQDKGHGKGRDPRAASQKGKKADAAPVGERNHESPARIHSGGRDELAGIDELPGIGGLARVERAADRFEKRDNIRTAQPEASKLRSSLPLIGQARLTDMSAGKSYVLTKSPMVVGRESSSDIVLSDANVSRQHAKFTQDAVGTWKITDMNSTNGTRLNGRRVSSALLRDGDQVAIGVTVLEFREF